MRCLRLLPFLLSAAVCLSLQTMSLAQIPQKPVPPRLVNDFANVFTASEHAFMESTLVAFGDSMSNQITVVTVDDLQGYDVAQFAYEIGQRWGVGSKKYNNGIVVVLKPSNENGYGAVNISVGYGLEGAIPDALCKRIIEKEMTPFYAEGKYYEGTLKGVETLMKLAAGEISAGDYDKFDWASLLIFALIFICFIVIITILSRRRPPSDGDGTGGRASRTVFWGGMGGFGGSSGGGRSGGFGGFGGGSFGGGGASGRF
jgi:uncharacterized protein